MRVTIKDVAKAAKVSITSVSHTLSGSRIVAPETAERIWHAVRSLGYQPSHTARGLRKRRTNNLALIVPDMNNYFYTSLVKLSHQYASQNMYQLLVRYSEENPETEKIAIKQLLAQNLVDGIVLVPTGSSYTFLSDYIKEGTKIVAVNRRLHDVKIPMVIGNNEEAAYLLASHLIGLGHKKIGAILTREGISTGDDRLTGFLRAMKEYGVNESFSVWRPLNEKERPKRCDGYEGTRELLAKRETPSALLAGSFQIAEGAVMALRDTGMSCPEKIALAAFGSAWPAQVLNPRLTVMEQGVEEMASKAIELLSRWIESGVMPVGSFKIGTKFFIGDSCGWKMKHNSVPSIASPDECPCGLSSPAAQCKYCIISRKEPRK